jgi:phosphatidylethanolamine/phosphatidyl-N-methylethanolamine N-methyltransferase
MRDRVAERSHFFRQWVKAPLVTASIIPSSQALATGMVRTVIPGEGPVVELGPGSGVITRHLIDRGVAEEDLVLVECNPYFAGRLRARFPRARVVQGFAQHVAAQTFDMPPAVVVSGLPLMSMPNSRVEAIARAVFAVLRPGGRLIQFTYAPRCPVNRPIRERLGLDARLQEVVWRNVPPARVYQLRRFGE